MRFEPTSATTAGCQCLAADRVETVAMRAVDARHVAETLGLLVKTDRVADIRCEFDSVYSKIAA